MRKRLCCSPSDTLPLPAPLHQHPTPYTLHAAAYFLVIQSNFNVLPPYICTCVCLVCMCGCVCVRACVSYMRQQMSYMHVLWACCMVAIIRHMSILPHALTNPKSLNPTPHTLHVTRLYSALISILCHVLVLLDTSNINAFPPYTPYTFTRPTLHQNAFIWNPTPFWTIPPLLLRWHPRTFASNTFCACSRLETLGSRLPRLWGLGP